MGIVHYICDINIVSITAIMRGAVIHKIDSDSVKSRRMPKSYGVTYNVEFRPGHHPASRKIVGIDGVIRCKDVMDWYVRKVQFREIETMLMPERSSGEWEKPYPSVLPQYFTRAVPCKRAS